MAQRRTLSLRRRSGAAGADRSPDRSAGSRHSMNVKNWQNGNMALRWCAAGMIEARGQFRRVNGHLHLPALRGARRARRCENCRCCVSR